MIISSGQQAVVFASDDLIALAGALLESRAVENVNMAADLADQAGVLEFAGRDCYAFAADTEEMRKHFLCQTDLVVHDTVVAKEKPAAKPLLESVEAATRGDLRHVRQEVLSKNSL